LATSGPAFLPDGQHGGWDVLVVGEAMRKILRIASKGLRVPNLAQYVGTWANRMNNVHFPPCAPTACTRRRAVLQCAPASK